MDQESYRTALANYIETELTARKRFTRFWSFVHHGTLFGTTFLSAAAALVLQLKIIALPDPSRSDYATIFAAAASLVSVISVSGAFAAKWRVNRLTRVTLEALRLDMMTSEPDLDKIRGQLKKMWRLHNSVIIDEPDLAKDKSR
jgi:hypothetical protein